ncbi:MAG: DUF5675 family protein [Bacteroidales bacterium]
MELLLKRRFLGETYTIGSLYIDGVYFCDTLEDKTRDLNKNGVLDGSESKVMHKTAIPYGVYQIVVNLSPKFKRNLPRLLNVPHFEGILIHRGNTDEDSSGCILVGENKVKGKVVNSTGYEIKLVELMNTIQSEREQITIKIV